MNEYTLESFINFCDEYQMANESFSSIKAKLVEAFSRLVLWIESKVKKMKDSKVKATLLSLIPGTLIIACANVLLPVHTLSPAIAPEGSGEVK